MRVSCAQSPQCRLQGTVVSVIIVFVLDFFVFVLIFVNEFIIISILPIFVLVFVNENHTGVHLCSLAVEPQYPQLCIRQSDVDQLAAMSSSSSAAAEMLGPMELSAVLNSLPCSLTFTADDHLNVIQTLVALVSTTSTVIIIIIITRQGDLRLAPTSPVQTKIQLKVKKWIKLKYGYKYKLVYIKAAQILFKD